MSTLSLSEEPTTFTLTTEQQEAIAKIWDFLESDKSFFLLGGYAGTGKSTIILKLLAELPENIWPVLTAPTNKAVTVLSKIAANNNLSIDGMTIHKLLGLGMVNQGDKKVLGVVSESHLFRYNLVILDECSMISAELWEIICQEFERNLFNKKKLILMGDPAQLNPVGEKRSPSFAIKNRTVLTEVIRQSNHSPIMDFVNQTRLAVNSKNYSQVFLPKSTYQPPDKSNGAFKVNRQTLLSVAIDKINKYADTDPDRFRVLCWTNKRVDYYNHQVRTAIYGKKAPRFVPGERLITRKPIVAPDGKTILFTTSTEVTVKSVEQDRYCGYSIWALTVVTDEKMLRQIFVLHENERSRYETELERLRQNAIKNPRLWRRYYQFKDELFAKVRNCYALTVHNSQGSTFREGGIDGDDLFSRLLIRENNWKQTVKEYHRLWYVAASRFSQRVLFIAPNRQKIELLD